MCMCVKAWMIKSKLSREERKALHTNVLAFHNIFGSKKSIYFLVTSEDSPLNSALVVKFLCY